MTVMVKQRAHVQHIKEASHALVAELIHTYYTGMLIKVKPMAAGMYFNMGPIFFKRLKRPFFPLFQIWANFRELSGSSILPWGFKSLPKTQVPLL